MEIHWEECKENLLREQWIGMDSKGQITVFISLLLSSLLILFVAAVEITGIYMNKARVSQASKGACENIKADYNTELFEDYHLLLLDKTYMGRGEAELEARISDYMEYTLSGDGFEIDDVVLTDSESVLDNDLEAFKEQIEEYMKLYLTVQTAENLVDALASDNSNEEVADAIEDGKYEESDETSDWDGDDIRDTLNDGLNGGLLNIVIPADKTVSKDVIDLSECPSKSFCDGNDDEDDIDTSFDDIDKLEEELGTSTGSDSALAENYYGIMYALTCFDFFTDDSSGDGVFCYEVEYLIGGKDNDYDNLSAVVNRIILHRLPVNIAVLLTDKTRMAEIESMALVLSLVPGITYGAAKYLLAACYAYGETVVEVRSLLSGNSIPAIKKSEDWILDIENFGDFVDMEEVNYMGADAVDYKDFLMLFLAESHKNMYYRMCDLMQLNICKTDEDFLIENCINAFSVDIKISKGSDDYSLSCASSY